MKYIFWKPTPDSVDLMDAIVYSSDTFGLAPQDYAKRWPETALSVRQSIKDNFYGELPICQAIVVGILDEYKKKYLIVTPTCYSEAVPVSDNWGAVGLPGGVEVGRGMAVCSTRSGRWWQRWRPGLARPQAKSGPSARHP